MTFHKPIHQLYLSLFNDIEFNGFILFKVGRWVPVESNTKNKAEMVVEMSGITWPGNSILPPLGKPEKRFFRIVTLKEQPYVFYLDNDANDKCVPPSVPCRVMKDKVIR